MSLLDLSSALAQVKINDPIISPLITTDCPRIHSCFYGLLRKEMKRARNHNSSNNKANNSDDDSKRCDKIMQVQVVVSANSVKASRKGSATATSTFSRAVMFYVHRKESPSRCILCHGMICATIYLFHARWHVAYRLVTIGLVCSLFLLPVLYTKFCQSGAKFSLVHKSQMVLFLGKYYLFR